MGKVLVAFEYVFQSQKFFADSINGGQGKCQFMWLELPGVYLDCLVKIVYQ
jgi:hypothetical protein